MLDVTNFNKKTFQFIDATNYRIVSSKGNDIYNVSITKHGKNCTCPHTVHRGIEKPCRHLKEILEVLKFSTLRNQVHKYLNNAGVKLYQVLSVNYTKKGMITATYRLFNGGKGCCFVNPDKLGDSATEKFFVITGKKGDTYTLHTPDDQEVAINLNLIGYAATSDSTSERYDNFYDASVKAMLIGLEIRKNNYQLHLNAVLKQLANKGISASTYETIDGKSYKFNYPKNLATGVFGYIASLDKYFIQVGRNGRHVFVEYSTLSNQIIRACGLA
jgi:hypothetical protein